ncbi:MAG: protein kinase [Deltaproteobacteria bacterium]|nr:protein kinase [Deltaproteobacteria bacterium]
MQSAAMVAEYLCPECERVFASGEERCPYDRTRLVNLGAGLASGTVIDNRYTIKRLLGKGGMGSVYVARQHSMDRDVAIKIMHHRADGNQAAVQRFFWEVRAARRLQSPHTITVFDFGQTERGSLYLAMELLKGTTLGHRLSMDGKVPAARAMRITAQICRSLEEAHGNSIIHRDLKPENIFLCQRGAHRDFVKVLDFGVAKFLDPDGHMPLTQTGTVFGTPRYMSPEQANSERVDARSDLYALGIILYEMLTGKVPFAEENPLEILYKHVHAKPIPLAEAAPWLEVDKRVGQLVDAMLAKRREDRPVSATVVRGELEALLANMPDDPGDVTAEESAQPPGGMSTQALAAGGGGGAGAPRDGVNETRDAIEGAGTSLRTALPTPSLGVKGRTEGTARLVGRKTDQQRAKKALEDALKHAQPRMVWITGEPGIGKRRFVRWLCEVAQKELTVQLARGVRSGGYGGELAEMRAAFDDLFGTSLLERAALRERLEEHAAFSDRLDLDLLDALVAFLRPTLSADTATAGDAGQPASHELFSALHRLVVRLAKIQPLVIDFGLLNEADQQTRRFLEHLAGALSQASARVLLLVRVDAGALRRHQVLRGVQELVGWRGSHDAQVHELVALSRFEPAEFAEYAQVRGRGFGHLTPYLYYLSGGNPGDAAELVETIEANPDHLRAARSWNPVGQRVALSDLPSTLVDRAERLLETADAGGRLTGSKDAQTVLRHAALLGASFDAAVLEKALEREGRPELLDAVEETLEALVHAGCLIQEKATGRLRFESGVLREVVLAQIMSPRALKKLHLNAAETLEQLPDRAQRALELAGHWEGADQLDKALDYRLQHARAAQQRDNPDEALTTFQLALDTLRKLVPTAGRTPERDALERKILLDLGRLRASVGTYEQAARDFRALVDLAIESKNQKEIADAELGLADVQDALAEYGSASELLKSAADRYRALNLPVEAARCEFRRGASLERRGQAKAARESYDAARKVFALNNDSRGLADTYHALGMLSLQEGDAGEALRQLRRAVDMHRQLGSGLQHGKVLYDLSTAASERREYVLALDSATKALDVFDRENYRLGISQCLGTIARALLNQHRPAEARPFFERALRIREELGDRRGVGESVSALASIALELDQPERALELARRAREIFASVGEFLGAASALRTMGVAESALGRFESALNHLREAVATYKGLSKQDPELCTILESLADCQELMQLRVDARETLTDALKVARELQAKHHIAHLEARLRATLN